MFPVLAPLRAADPDLRLLGIGKTASALARSSSRTAYNPYPAPRGPGRGHATSLVDSTSQLSPSPSVIGTIPLVDLRLKDVKIQRWTSVPVSDWFGAGVISFYLGNEHPLLGVFDADLLIGDLVRGEGSFCSPLLISALLAWSCVSLSPSLPGMAGSLTSFSRLRMRTRILMPNDCLAPSSMRRRCVGGKKQIVIPSPPCRQQSS